MIIGISGKAQHGKDTTATYLKSILEKRGCRVLVVHFADLLKFICKEYFGWNGEKDDEGRSLLQKVGTDIRALDECYFVNFINYMLVAFNGNEELGEQWDHILIPDVRYKNEVSRLNMVHLSDFLHLRVVRPYFDNGLTDAQKAHKSETDLDNVEPDIVIVNDGSKMDLYKKVDMIAEEFFW